MLSKLQSLGVDSQLIFWIIQFLVNRTQAVFYQNTLSSVKTTSTGSPQGTVLSPVLFTLYTNDCTGSDSSLLIKYSDDSAILDLSNSHSSYVKVVENFSSWCRENFLELNVKKTKEMVVDFRKSGGTIPDLCIGGEVVERVENYKYLGTVIDNKMKFDDNTDYVYKKCQSRLFCLQKLRSLNVNQDILCSFYRCFLESVLTFGFLAWYGGLSVKNRNVLERVVRVSGKVIGKKQMSLSELYEKRASVKALGIVKDKSHVLAQYFEVLPSGTRFRSLRFSSNRFGRTFVNNAISILNKKTNRGRPEN